MIISTNILDKAAFFLVFWGKLVDLKGQYPENEYIISTNKAIMIYESLGGFVPYKIFCNKRRYLKRKARKIAGLPIRFTGDTDSHFTFSDLVRVSFHKNEKK